MQQVQTPDHEWSQPAIQERQAGEMKRTTTSCITSKQQALSLIAQMSPHPNKKHMAGFCSLTPH
eukprot:14422082-Ditylum_brightwellii.AAC.1